MSGRARLTPVKPAGRRILADLAAREGEVLIYKPRRGIWQCGRDGAAARCETFTDLESSGLIAIWHGFAMAVRAQITAAGRARLAGRAANPTPDDDGGQA